MDIAVIIVTLFGAFWLVGAIMGTCFGYLLRAAQKGPVCKEELEPVEEQVL